MDLVVVWAGDGWGDATVTGPTHLRCPPLPADPETFRAALPRGCRIDGFNYLRASAGSRRPCSAHKLQIRQLRPNA